MNYSIGDLLSDDEAMAFAIALAYQGNGYVAPNPMVGCVVLDPNHKLLSFGYHEKYGEAHAEVNAFAKLSNEELESAIVYVSLEPCSHFGKTPPCAELLASKPIAKLIYGQMDPNPQVAGKGLDLIKKSGIKVEQYKGKHEDGLKELTEVFFHNMTQGQCFWTVKVATSIDGIMALSSGESKWITGEEARSYSHELRAIHDMICIGKNTLLLDNPSLNIRSEKYPNKENRVLIFDPGGELLARVEEFQIYKTHKAQNIFFVTKTVNDECELLLHKESGCQQILCPEVDDSQFDLDLLSKFLWKELKQASVFVEGGSYTISELIRERKLNRIYHFVAPIILGNHENINFTKYFSISRMNEKVELKSFTRKAFGKDQLTTARVF